MRNITVLFLLSLIFATYSCEETDNEGYLNGTWTINQDASDPLLRCYSATGFEIDNKIFITTGANEYYLYNLWCYDVQEKEWSEKANFVGMARAGAIGFSDGQYGFVGLGQVYNKTTYDTLYFSDLHCYNPAEDSWTEMSGFEGMPRSHAVAYVIGDTAYVATGQDTLGNPLSDFWAYNMKTDKWLQKNDLPIPARYDAVSFALDGKGYIGTGTTDGITTLNDFWCYTPENGTWRKIKSPPTGYRLGAHAFTIDTLAYIGGGWDKGELLNDLQMYYPKQDRWYKQKSMGDTGRMHSMAFGMQGYGIVCTAFNEYDFWEFVP